MTNDECRTLKPDQSVNAHGSCIAMQLHRLDCGAGVPSCINLGLDRLLRQFYRHLERSQ
jgi:hypothetical protein